MCLQAASLVAPKPESIAAVNAWLAENDIVAKNLTSRGDWLAFEVPVSKANALFDADFGVYAHNETGLEAVRTLAYSIPDDVAPYVSFVYPTTE